MERQLCLPPIFSVSPTRVRSARTAGTQVAASPELPTRGNSSTNRRRAESARGPGRGPGEGRGKSSLSGHVQADSRRVGELRPGAAADRCLLGSLSPSWRSWGRGGDVSAPPRPGSQARTGFSGCVGLPGSCGCRRRGRPAALPQLSRWRSRVHGETPALLHPPRPDSRHPSGPEPAARASRAPGALRAALPRLGLQVMLLRFGCPHPSRRVARPGPAGRKRERPLRTGLDGSYFVVLQLLDALF